VIEIACGQVRSGLEKWQMQGAGRFSVNDYDFRSHARLSSGKRPNSIREKSTQQTCNASRKSNPADRKVRRIDGAQRVRMWISNSGDFLAG
jgi:hypothetical protein